MEFDSSTKDHPTHKGIISVHRHAYLYILGADELEIKTDVKSSLQVSLQFSYAIMDTGRDVQTSPDHNIITDLEYWVLAFAFVVLFADIYDEMQIMLRQCVDNCSENRT